MHPRARRPAQGCGHQGGRGSRRHHQSPRGRPGEARVRERGRHGGRRAPSGRARRRRRQHHERGRRGPKPAASSGSQAVAAGPAGQTVQCDGDGSTGNRVQVVYVHGPDRDRYAEYVASFRKWAADADLIYSASAKETGGVRHIRYVTAADCTPTVLNIELPSSALSEFSATNRALAGKGLDRRDRKYMIFADTKVYCGIGTFAGDERPGQNNQSNFGPSYGRTDAGCWGGHTAAHELGHNLGAVNNSAPNTSRGAHCTDEYDVMCYSDTPYYPTMRYVCSNQAAENILDCNHDDYFHTNPKAGSYLATHWNTADNQFLMRSGGGLPRPGPQPDAHTDPHAHETDRRTSGDGRPDTVHGRRRELAQGRRRRLVPGSAGRQAPDLGPVAVAAHLQPPARHRVQGRRLGPRPVRPRQWGRTGDLLPYGRRERRHDHPGTRYTLGNAGTGMAAEVWGGRSADGTVLVGARANGYAQQQWLFDDAGGGLVRLRSAVSGKCLQTGGAPAAGMWVAQQSCGGIATQKWKLSSRGGAITVTDPSGTYALTVSNRPYYGSWLLDLQRTDGRAAQAWTVQKVS